MKKTMFLAMGLSSMVAYAQYEKRVGINTDTPRASLEVKAVDFDGRTQGVLFPHISDEEKEKWKEYDAETNKTGLVAGTVIWNTDQECLEYYDGVEWNCINDNNTGRIKTPKNSVIKLPEGIIVDNSEHWIVSVKDNKYIPFTAPISSAEWIEGETTGSDPMIDILGQIPLSGVRVEIPIRVSQNLTLPAYKAYAVTPAEAWQDKKEKILELSWSQRMLTTSDYKITAFIKVYEATADQNLIKLDLEKGLGKDYNGLLLGQFKIPKNNTQTSVSAYTGIFDVRVMSLIPDKKFGEADKKHDFLYMPIVVIGKNGYKKIWLSNNLGATYSDIRKGLFNPTKQATSYNDYNAYGSLFQWQRQADGHELINWTSSTGGAYDSHISGPLGTTGWKSNNPRFIIGSSSSSYSWVDASTNSSNHNLWQKEGANNPCPTGYHIPEKSEWDVIETALGGSQSNYSWASSVLKLSSAGNRSFETGGLINQTKIARYWTSTRADTYDYSYSWDAKNDGTSGTAGQNRRAGGFAIRCMKD